MSRFHLKNFGNEFLRTTIIVGFSWWMNVLDDDVPDEAPADDADAFVIDPVIDCK